jgi:prevent-host-death family protein
MKSASAEPQIVTHNGKPVSVIVPIEQYEELLERAEDAVDIAWLQRARRKSASYRSLDDYLASRKEKRRV